MHFKKKMYTKNDADKEKTVWEVEVRKNGWK